MTYEQPWYAESALWNRGPRLDCYRNFLDIYESGPAAFVTRFRSRLGPVWVKGWG